MVHDDSNGVGAAKGSADPQTDDRLADVDPLSGGWGILTQQADEILDETTTAVEVVGHLDLTTYARDDPYPEWHDAKPFEPMLRAILLAELTDASDAAVHRTLETDPDTAAILGFDPEDVPDQSTLSRARNNRFAEIERTIEVSCRQIRTLAARRGSPIGAPNQDSASTEPTGSSKRTVNRLIRGKTREVLDELTTVVFPAFDFDRSEDAIYADKELLLLETLLGVTGTAANGGAETYGDYVNPDPDLDDPFFADGPTGETLLEAIKTLDIEEITEMINRGAARVLTRAKPYVEFEQPAMLAIDMTYIAYYGEREELVRVQGAPEDKSYDWCHKVATASIVGDNVLFTAAMLPIGDADDHDPDAYAGEERSYRVGGVVRRLVDIVEARANLRIRRVFADREFHATDVVAALEERDLFYVIPAARDDRIKRFIARMNEDVDGQKQVTVRDEYGIYGPVKDSGGVRKRAETTLVALPPDEDRDQTQVFLTNLDVNDEIRLDRRSTRRRIKRYTRRGGIENAYGGIKQFAPWTTSREYGVRLFHFGFAMLLYDMWLLVDLLVQRSLGIVEFRTKPRVIAPRFRGFLRRRLVTLI
ncbi:transposase [Halobacterium salinarum]|uniref:transposase n=1 Tax=Halobacteriales TaxID=2235 RepID=UPI00246888AF|nr:MULTISPECIES: transposase [Halobacteria]MDL0131178.1 transposase [Halobacterium salinarum]MDL0131316.1 transposase [Halobacterium salinarum]MDL0138618.1 transposase [Halobacterium salinarum]